MVLSHKWCLYLDTNGYHLNRVDTIQNVKVRQDKWKTLLNFSLHAHQCCPLTWLQYVAIVNLQKCCWVLILSFFMPSATPCSPCLLSTILSTVLSFVPYSFQLLTVLRGTKLSHLLWFVPAVGRLLTLCWDVAGQWLPRGREALSPSKYLLEETQHSSMHKYAYPSAPVPPKVTTLNLSFAMKKAIFSEVLQISSQPK